MFAYLWGVAKAIFAPGWLAWIGLLLAYILGIGFFSDYEKAKNTINHWQQVYVMPDTLPPWLIVFPFFVWAFLRLAHKEGMWHGRSARIVFDDLRVVPSWHLYVRDQHGNILSDEIMSAVTIAIRNSPQFSESGNDVEMAWARVELFNLNGKPIQDWDFARWEDNPQPPYSGSVFYSHDSNYRRLSSNRSPHLITIATKRLLDEYADRLRGIDQTTNWMDPQNRIPKGEFFARLTIDGKGLQKPAIHVFMLNNPGRDRELKAYKSEKSIPRYWPI